MVMSRNGTFSKGLIASVLVLLTLLGSVVANESLNSSEPIGCAPTIDNRVVIGDVGSAQSNWRAFIAKLSIKLVNGSNYICSASLLRRMAPEPFMVWLTAAHCFQNKVYMLTDIQSVVININGVSSDVQDWTGRACTPHFTREYNEQNYFAEQLASVDYGLIICHRPSMKNPSSFAMFANNGLGLTVTNVTLATTVNFAGVSAIPPTWASTNSILTEYGLNVGVSLDDVADTFLMTSKLTIRDGTSGSPILYYDPTANDMLVIGVVSNDDNTPDGPSCKNYFLRLHPDAMVEMTSVITKALSPVGTPETHEFGLGTSSSTFSDTYWLWVDATGTIQVNQFGGVSPRSQNPLNINAIWGFASAYIPGSFSNYPNAQILKFVYNNRGYYEPAPVFRTRAWFLSADVYRTTPCHGPSNDGCGYVSMVKLPPRALYANTPLPQSMYFRWPVLQTTAGGINQISLQTKLDLTTNNIGAFVRLYPAGSQPNLPPNLQVVPPSSPPGPGEKLNTDGFDAGLWNQ